jgi:thiol:disulfide interchange protein DsbD
VTSPTRSPISGDLLRYLVLGFFGGMILNLMPCVLPVIGLKIMSFAQQAGESSSRILWLNICFVAGLVTVFMVLAALAAFAGWGWGAQFQRPEFAIVLALIVFVFALSFLGTWEIPIPGFVGSGKAAQAAQGEGPSGAFAKGVLTTLLATPCSGPLIVPTLAWAIPQSKPVIFAVFLAMGLGMGAPYLAIGLAPGLLKFLPKPGAWMETFKQVMGFVLLATVVWIFTFLDKDFFVPTLALLFAAWAACWWVGRVALTADLSDKLRAYLIGSVFTAVLGYMAFSTLGPGKHWEQFSTAKLAKLRSSNTTVFVDFTADWCVSCKVNEAAAVKTDRTQDFISAHGIQFLIADKTKPSPEIDALLVELGNTIKAVPFYAIFPGDGRDPIVFNDVPLLEDTLIDRLEMAVDPARNIATHNDVSASSSL